MENKLFTSSIDQSKNSQLSRVKYNREYLLSNATAGELNTYMSWGIFPVFTDTFNEPKDANELKTSTDKFGSPGVRSLFSKTGGILLGGQHKEGDHIESLALDSEWRISNNVPLMDNPDNRKAIKKYSGCSVKELVAASQNGELGKETYDYSDFMYCKHLGKMSNNYMITLRRFPIPVDDYISSSGTINRTNPDLISQNSQSIGCMVTWIGTAGNEISNILKYSYSMPFKSQDAQWEDDDTNADSQQGILNSVAAVFDKRYREQYAAGMAGTAGNKAIGILFPKLSNYVDNGPYNVRDFAAFRDRNKVYGPVDAIKSTYMRDSRGLEFNQDITITFDYELRSYNGINGRQAFLDLISNILNVTYSTGTFWGGGYRSTGAHQSNIFTNMKIFQAKGGVTDFINAFSQDLTTIGGPMGTNLKNALSSPMEFVKTIGSFMNSLGGMILGGMLNKLGRPHKVMLNSLLSPAPVGFWHLTIGNPHHPIMSAGNMILKNTTIEHYGPLGLDDFPTGIKVTCELTRGKPRDIRDIEKLYMKGTDRIYHSMGPKALDMYKYAKEYKQSSKSNQGSPNEEIGGNPVTIEDFKASSNVIKKYFGHSDGYSIHVSASEQEYGSSEKKKQK